MTSLSISIQIDTQTAARGLKALGITGIVAIFEKEGIQVDKIVVEKGSEEVDPLTHFPMYLESSEWRRGDNTK